MYLKRALVALILLPLHVLGYSARAGWAILSFCFLPFWTLARACWVRLRLFQLREHTEIPGLARPGPVRRLACRNFLRWVGWAVVMCILMTVVEHRLAAQNTASVDVLDPRELEPRKLEPRKQSYQQLSLRIGDADLVSPPLALLLRDLDQDVQSYLRSLRNALDESDHCSADPWLTSKQFPMQYLRLLVASGNDIRSHIAAPIQGERPSMMGVLNQYREEHKDDPDRLRAAQHLWKATALADETLLADIKRWEDMISELRPLRLTVEHQDAGPFTCDEAWVSLVLRSFHRAMLEEQSRVPLPGPPYTPRAPKLEVLQLQPPYGVRMITTAASLAGAAVVGIGLGYGLWAAGQWYLAAGVTLPYLPAYVTPNYFSLEVMDGTALAEYIQSIVGPA